MGCGKTTLGGRLAMRLGVPFLDLDGLVEARAGAPIAALVARDGEPAFRCLELEELRHLVASAPACCVVATGGGVVESPEGRALVAGLGHIVWLFADPEAAVARLGAAGATRPLLAPGNDWRERWRRREALYRELAHDIVPTHPEGVEESLTQLVAVAERCWGNA